MANKWKTKEEIIEDYGLSTTGYYRLRAEILASKYEDAIILVGDKTFIVEERFRDFLIAKSNQRKEEMYGARVRRGRKRVV